MHEFYTIGTDDTEGRREIYGIAYNLSGEVTWVYDYDKKAIRIESGMVDAERFFSSLHDYIEETGMVEFEEYRVEEATDRLLMNELNRQNRMRG